MPISITPTQISNFAPANIGESAAAVPTETKPPVPPPARIEPEQRENGRPLSLDIPPSDISENANSATQEEAIASFEATERSAEEPPDPPSPPVDVTV